MTPQHFLHIFKILESMQISLSSYIAKFPEKKTDKFTIERIENLQALKGFYNSAVDYKKQQNELIERQQKHIRLMERNFENMFKILIKTNQNQAVSNLERLICYDEMELNERQQKIYDMLIVEVIKKIHLDIAR